MVSEQSRMFFDVCISLALKVINLLWCLGFSVAINPHLHQAPFRYAELRPGKPGLTCSGRFTCWERPEPATA